MDFVARSLGSRRGALALVLAGIVAVFVMAVTAPAQAAPNVGYAWGNNYHGQLGDGTTEGPEKCNTEPCSATPVDVKALSGVTAVAGGADHSLALLENGTIMGWGDNFYGELGNGETKEKNDLPVAVCAAGETAPCANHLSEVAAVAAEAGGGFQEGNFSLALLKNGEVRAWGNNGQGQLGNGTTTNSDVPVVVCAMGATSPCSEESQRLKGVVAIAAGSEQALAVLSDGTVVAWGANNAGQLGNGTTTSSDVPVAVSGLTGVTAVAAGREFSLALLGNGSVMAWGENRFGQLGTGNATSSHVPVAVSGLSGVSAISAGPDHSLALLKNGEVKAWGQNGVGQLGDGTSSGPEKCGGGGVNEFACAKTPVTVSGLSGATAIAAGQEFSLARLKGASVLAWGRNDQGELGVGSTSGPEACPGTIPTPCSTKPVPVLTHGAVVGIGAGGAHALAFGPPPSPPTPLPELGRCKPVKKGTGQYKGKICNHLSPTHRGNTNWSPEAEKKGFEGSGSGGVTILASPKITVSCSTTLIKGEWTGAKTAKATLVLKGCENAANEKRCQSSPSKEGEIESTMPLEGELGFIQAGAKPIVGLDLKKSSTAPSLAAFFCGSGPEPPEDQGNIEGSVIGQLKLVNKMVSAFTLTYKGAKGSQTPERFEGGLKDTLSFVFPPKGVEPHAVEENVSLSATVSITNEEPLEIKANTYPS